MKANKILQILKWGSFFIFIGRAYQYLFWDAPFRTLLWDQALLEPLVNSLLNMEWQDYATNLKIDGYINSFQHTNGIIFLIAAIAALFINKKNQKLLKFPIFIGGIFIIMLSLLLTKEKFYHIPMFFEHTIQFSTPFLLLSFIKYQKTSKLVLHLKIAIALTFTCHGLYAIGILYPLPGNFVTMCLNILPISETTAIRFLFIAGILDFAVAILLFIPRLWKFALLYAILWGFLTALARVVGPFSFDFTWQSLHQNLYQTVYRIPHGLIPLLLYFIMKKAQGKGLRSY